MKIKESVYNMRDIINNGEEIIGKVGEVIEYFKDEMIRQIKEINIFGEYIECNDIEDKQNNLDLIWIKPKICYRRANI